MSEPNIETIEKYLQALREKDLSSAPFHSEMKFSDPLAGEDVGADKFRAFMSGFLPGITGVRVFRHVSDGEYVSTYWEVDGIFGPIAIMQLFRVRDGEILESIALYDPRPVMGN